MTPVFCSELFRDYLAHADSIADGVPADDVLRKQALSDLKVAAPPRMLVAVKSDPEKKHTTKLIYEVHIVIDAEVAGTDRDTVDGWARTIRARIEKGTDYRFQVLESWIQANRTEQQRTGWQIERLRLFPSEDDFSVEKEMNMFSVIIPMRLTMRVR